jgi:hypothetical protein
MTPTSSPITVCEAAFSVYLAKFPQMTSYTSAVTPHLLKEPDAVPFFIDSSVVLMMAWHEEFLKSIFAYGIRHREAAAREYFAAHGHDSERPRAGTCDLRELIGMGRRRVTFKGRGAVAEKLFLHLFEFGLWPSDDVRDRVADVSIIRQLIVHHGGASLGDDYWNQLSDKALVTTTQYGDLPAIRRIDYGRCLVFLKDAFLALATQAYHLRDEMLKRPEWTYRPA